MYGLRAPWFAVALLLACFATSTSFAQASPTFVQQWGTLGSGAGHLNTAAEVALDPSGETVWVADYLNHRIQKFSTSGSSLGQVGTFGTGSGQFRGAYGIATADDVNGTYPYVVYVSDSANHRIQKFDSNGNHLSQWGSQGSGNGQFVNPVGLGTDAEGNLYVADQGNHRIQKFDANGNHLFHWGSFGTGNGQFRDPYDATVDEDGNVFVADLNNARIQKFDANGVYLSKWGGPGSGPGQFAPDGPRSLFFDLIGTLYAADSGNHRIQTFSELGVFGSQWGSLPGNLPPDDESRVVPGKCWGPRWASQ